MAIATETLVEQLHHEFATPRLDRLAPHLWLVAKPDSRHISSLTHQTVRGRQIVITEDPGMHLLWYEGKVFIKPLPKYLLSHAFWVYLNAQARAGREESWSTAHNDIDRWKEVISSALGLLRSYAFLLRHKSDFQFALSCNPPLLPRQLRFRELVELLITVEERIQDAHVSPRWRFGELRLSRLNFWSKVFLHDIEYAKFYAPLLFIFGVFSVILGALQVDGLFPTELITSVAKGFLIFTFLLILSLEMWYRLALRKWRMWWALLLSWIQGVIRDRSRSRRLGHSIDVLRC
ncbi:hypothetical protein GGR57DRAFT_496242 [Xylariaceae sp. FL1272]|nr:hypothetical protein GGR57DRAFT_496242 [Xylariaceae sp. FL1272]